MAYFDSPLEKLEKYSLPDYEPKDFDAFWAGTLAEAAKYPLDAKFEPVKDVPFKNIEVFDVTFNGFAGQPIKGWFVKPSGIMGKIPCIVQYIGYSGGRGFATDHTFWAAMGYAYLIMDSRGQGGASPGSPGATMDIADVLPHKVGFMTKGVESPQTYYYRRLFTDAARAVDAAIANPFVDASRIAVLGGSQGGGITIAAAALVGDKVKLAMPDVPFLCAYRRATEITDSDPYGEISAYLKTHRDRIEQTFKTLAYHDGVNFAPRIKARCLFSVGMMDTVCPPSTVFAAYNRIQAPKEIRVYHYNNHEGGGPYHTLEKMKFAAKYL
jgi:cephalosporin-C deacetylase